MAGARRRLVVFETLNRVYWYIERNAKELGKTVIQN